MELKEFIATALIDICDGIGNAKQNVQNAVISPATVTTPNGKETNVYGVERINFEICVTTESSNETEVKGGLKVISININGDKKTSDKDINVNKISFSVPYIPAAILKE